MKTSIARVLVAVAALALTAPAFAQLSINGYYRAGSMSNLTSYGTGTNTVFQDRIRLNLSFAAPDDMFGFKARLQADSYDSGATNNSALINLFTDKVSIPAIPAGGGAVAAQTLYGSPLGSLKYGYGYGKVLDGMVKLSAGYLDLTDYSVAENTGNYYFGNVFTDDLTGANTGILSGQKGRFFGSALQVWPIEGLSVAATMRTDNNRFGAHNMGLDAYYLVPGLGKAIVSSQVGIYSSTRASASDDLSKSLISGGFSYVGFPGLTATAVLRSTYTPASGTYIKKDQNAFGAVAIVEYGVGPLFADLSTDIDFTNSHVYFEGEASYLVIPQMKVRVYGAMADKANANINIALSNNTAVANKYAIGSDLVFPIGKGEIQAGVVYADQAAGVDTGAFQFPVLVKANF